MDEVKGFDYYLLRCSFWFMIGLWFIYSYGFIFDDNIIFALLWFVIIILTFVEAIINLVKYSKKAFSIVALVLSSFLILTGFIGFYVGMLVY